MEAYQRHANAIQVRLNATANQDHIQLAMIAAQSQHLDNSRRAEFHVATEALAIKHGDTYLVDTFHHFLLVQN